MRFDSFEQDRQRWGLARALYSRIADRMEQHLGIHLFAVHSRPIKRDLPQDELQEGAYVKALSEAELLALLGNPDLGLDADFVRQAYSRGDVCIGYVESGALAAYTWNGVSETPMEHGLKVRTPPGYAYGYKSFTLPSHRGRRLLEVLTHESDRWRAVNGFGHNISYVRTNNFSSTAADRRHGNLRIGYTGYVKWGARMFTFRTPYIARIGWEYVRPADASSSGDGNH